MLLICNVLVLFSQKTNKKKQKIQKKTTTKSRICFYQTPLPTSFKPTQFLRSLCFQTYKIIQFPTVSTKIVFNFLIYSHVIGLLSFQIDQLISLTFDFRAKHNIDYLFWFSKNKNKNKKA